MKFRLIGKRAAPPAPSPSVRAQLEDAAREVVQQGAFSLVAQPIVSLREPDARLGRELLSRFAHPAFSHATNFFSVAGTSGLMGDFSTRFFDRLLPLLAVHPDETFFVNCHPEDLGRLSEEVGEPWSAFRRLGPQLVLELSKYHRIANLGALREQVLALKRRGFRLAIDDVGDGHASLATVAALEPDVLKVGAGLVRDLHEHRLHRRVVGAFVRLCDELGLVLVAESIETAEELRCVTELGCHAAQGFFLARPAPLPPAAPAVLLPLSQGSKSA